MFVVESCCVLGGVFVCELWLCWVVGLFCCWVFVFDFFFFKVLESGLTGFSWWVLFFRVDR